MKEKDFSDDNQSLEIFQNHLLIISTWKFSSLFGPG